MTWIRKRVVCIVEGRGEELAAPRLVERWIRQHGLYRDFVVEERALCANGVTNLRCAHDHRHRQRGIEYFVRVALASDPHALLIVLDADKECQRRSQMREQPVGVEILERARAVAPPAVGIAVVVAEREFEAWFVEHRGVIGFPLPDAWTGASPVEAIADCKKVVGELLGRRYDPVIDQPMLASRLPLLSPDSDELAACARSYRKLITSLARLMPPPRMEDSPEG